MTGLDLIDRKIVARLMRNATLPITQIADTLPRWSSRQPIVVLAPGVRLL